MKKHRFEKTLFVSKKNDMVNNFYHEWALEFGWILGLIILSFFVCLITKVIKKDSIYNSSGSKSALEILKERYATVEISKEGYKEKIININQ